MVVSSVDINYIPVYIDNQQFNAMEAYLKEQTECRVCFGMMVAPKILRCLHTFCAECVEKLVKDDGTIECPYCKSSCASDDIKDDFKAKQLIEIQTQEKTAAGPNESESGSPDPAEQLSSLREQVCTEIESRKQSNERAKVQVATKVEDCKSKWTAAFERQCDGVTKCLQKTFDNDLGVARLIKARDMVTAAEDYLRTCTSGRSVHSAEATGMAGLMTKDVNNIVRQVRHCSEVRAAIFGLGWSADCDCVDDVARRLLSPGGMVERHANDKFEIFSKFDRIASE